jgi:(4S)-4-hydroxy-5-phosphonooxypentane-2,3-dione isomerase
VYAILGTIKVKQEHLSEFVQHVRTHARNSLSEPGCLTYDVLQDRSDPLTICLYEVFRSEADLDAHHQQDYYKRWMEMSRDWRDTSAYTRRVLDRIFPDITR